MEQITEFYPTGLVHIEDRYYYDFDGFHFGDTVKSIFYNGDYWNYDKIQLFIDGILHASIDADTVASVTFSNILSFFRDELNMLALPYTRFMIRIISKHPLPRTKTKLYVIYRNLPPEKRQELANQEYAGCINATASVTGKEIELKAQKVETSLITDWKTVKYQPSITPFSNKNINMEHIVSKESEDGYEYNFTIPHIGKLSKVIAHNCLGATVELSGNALLLTRMVCEGKSPLSFKGLQDIEYKPECALAFLMSGHQRLGSDSLLYSFPREIIRYILFFAFSKNHHIIHFFRKQNGKVHKLDTRLSPYSHFVITIRSKVALQVWLDLYFENKQCAKREKKVIALAPDGYLVYSDGWTAPKGETDR